MKAGIFFITLLFSLQLVGQESTSEKVLQFYNRTSIGVLAGSESGLGLTTVNGITFNRYFAAGLGFGAENFMGNGHYLLFADLVAKLDLKQNTPFLSVNFGFTEPLRVDFRDKGGIFSGVSLGLAHYNFKRFGLYSSIGYRYSWVEFRDFWWEDNYTKVGINQIEMRLGIAFK